VAHIDIQKKSGSNWLWWILGLVILALLVWWLVGSTHRDSTTTSNGAVAAPAVVAAAPGMDSGYAGAASVITDLGVLTSSDSASALAARAVVLTGVPVASVVSDKGFWAGTGTADSQRVFVVRGNQSASYTAPDGAVSAGSRVNVYGVVQAMPADLTQQATDWNLKSTDSQALAAQRIYVQADSVRIASR
jgi:hypothetical protein